MEQAKWDRRRFPRWRAWEWLSGWIGPATKVSVIDISMAGALIEHAYSIQPGTLSILTLSLCEAKVSVKCRVVRSAPYRYETWPLGERNYVYRTGLELVDVSGASERLVGKYVEFLQAINGDAAG